MKLYNEKRLISFNGKTFEINFNYYKCEDSGEQFTTTALDELNIPDFTKLKI